MSGSCPARVDTRVEVRQQPRERARARFVAHQRFERLDERPVGRAHDGVGRTVQDQDALARRLGGELTREPALAGAGLAAEQHDPPLFAVRSREQRAQALELRRAADERERRGDTESAG